MWAQMLYVLYTSGSTGVPKGVIGTHMGALNRIAWMLHDTKLEPGISLAPVVAIETQLSLIERRIAHKTSLNFVDSVCEVFGTLVVGNTLVVLPDTTIASPPQLQRTLSQFRVSRLTLVPSLLRTLMVRSVQMKLECAS